MLPLTVHTEDGSYIQGQEFAKDFSEEEEAANLDSGLLELVECRYRVVGGSHVFETAPGDEFTAAMRIGQEALLVAGGHIERIDEPVVATPQRTTIKKKEK